MSPGGVGRSAAVGSDPAIDRSARRLLGGIAHVDFRGSEPGNFGHAKPVSCRKRQPTLAAIPIGCRPWEPMTLIDVRPGVRSGKPCFLGTRITVYDVLEYLAGGMSADDIVADFPELTLAHVHAALSFAALRDRRLAASA